eukprot:TRINITY_DN2635_c0_g2_i1.p1 TRINITY_DN2635_c0_g2~~TRINITY_DN2635_c0_g2_i1.p1  ORF type:complete len:746 (+),score=281.31 TRINITY_DN2635_c0_g2_i1:107-2344(+)
MTTQVNGTAAGTLTKKDRSLSANNLADEVVNLLDELLVNDKTPLPKQPINNSGSLATVSLDRSAETPMKRSSESSGRTSLEVPNGTTAPANNTALGSRSQSFNNLNSVAKTATPAAPAVRKVPTTPNPPTTTTTAQPASNLKFKPSWSSALSFSPRKQSVDEQAQDYKKRIAQLEEEIKMADAFKRSLKETLGLQVESLRMDLDLEREKAKRVESELNQLRQSLDNGPRTLVLSQSSVSAAASNPTLAKLVKVYEEEQKLLEAQKVNRQNNSKVVKDHEENIKKLVAQIKEESIFLIQLREKKASLEKGKNYQYTGSKPDQELGGKLAMSEANMKRLTDELEKEKKAIRDIESGLFGSMIDKKLDQYITLHAEVIAGYKTALEEGGNGGGSAALKQQLDEVTAQRAADKEYFENKSALFEKQFEELQNAKNSLDREKELILSRLDEEKQRIGKVEEERAVEAATLKNDLESKAKQLEDENTVLAAKTAQILDLQEHLEVVQKHLEDTNLALTEKTSQIALLQAQFESLQNQLSLEQKEKDLVRQQSLQTLQAEEMDFHRQIDDLQQKNGELQRSVKDLEEERVKLGEQISELQGEREKLRAEIAELTPKLTEAEMWRTVLLDKATEHEVSSKEQAALIEQLQTHRKELEENLTAAETRASELSQEIADLTAQLAEAKSAHESSQQTSQEQLEASNKRIEESEARIAELSKELEDQKTENATLTEKKNKLQEQFKLLKAMLSKTDE